PGAAGRPLTTFLGASFSGADCAVAHRGARSEPPDLAAHPTGRALVEPPRSGARRTRRGRGLPDLRPGAKPAARRRSSPCGVGRGRLRDSGAQAHTGLLLRLAPKRGGTARRGTLGAAVAHVRVRPAPDRNGGRAPPACTSGPAC